MATRANAATEKADTPTPSNAAPIIPKLRPNAPQLRTVEAIAQKHEQIFDALERDAISGKIAEQMGQQLKGIVNLAGMEMRFWQLVAKFKRKAPVPRNPILRSSMGLGPVISPTDGEFVRKLLPDEGR